MIIKRFKSNIPQPEDKHIFLKDILEDGEVDRDKSYCLDANYHKGGNPKRYFTKSSRQLDKLPQGAAIRNQITNHGVDEQLNVRRDGKSNCVVPSYPNKLNGMVQVGMASDINGKDQWRRIYSVEGKSPTVVGSGGGHHEPKISTVEIRRNGHGYIPTEVKEVLKSDTLRNATTYNYGIRKKSKTVRVGASNSPAGSKQEWDMISKDDYRRLSVVECERLQTMPDGYTDGVSNTQRYKCIGNSWTVDVVAHILSFSGL